MGNMALTLWTCTVSYKGLKKLHEEQLLDGFTVNPNTLTPDCTSCTKAKQSVKP